jgi:hypothetical protein
MSGGGNCLTDQTGQEAKKPELPIAWLLGFLASWPLLRLLGVKCGLLGFQFGDQFFGSINRDLITYRALYFTISLNSGVDLDALITHWSTAHFPA